MILTRPRRTPGRSPRRPVALVGLAVAGLSLSGCGGSLGIHPGSAAVIGDSTLSVNKIDDTTKLYCTAYLPTIAQQGTRLPLRLLRQYVAGSLSQRLLGEQLAQEYDVEPSSQYATSLSQIEQQFASASADVKAAAVEVEAGDPYLQTVEVSIGQKLLTASGQSTTSVKAQLQRGQVAAQDWLRTHPVHIDPVFGVSVDNGLFKPASDLTSYPVSALAVQSSDASTLSQSKTYAGYVSRAQLCG